MKKFDLAYVDNKTGYFLKKRKVIYRYAICFILPFIGFILATKYSIIILGIGYLLLDHLLMLFDKNNINIADKLLNIETCQLSESLLFDDKKEYPKEDGFDGLHSLQPIFIPARLSPADDPEPACIFLRSGAE